jgi:hypothetical protein
MGNAMSGQREVGRDLPKVLACEAVNQVDKIVSIIRRGSSSRIVLSLFLKKVAGGLSQKTKRR